MNKIVLVNMATLALPFPLELIAKACSAQLLFDVGGAWGQTPVPVEAHSGPEPTDKNLGVIALFDDSDQAGTLGWHALSPSGQPYGRVFVRDSGKDTPSVVSHEVVEMFLDAPANLWADDLMSRLYALEGCDPVEGRSYTIPLTDESGNHVVEVPVSDFVFPAWFEDGASGPFDFLNVLRASFELDEGGYAIYREGGQVHQVFGEKFPSHKLAAKRHPASRTMRRLRAVERKAA